MGCLMVLLNVFLVFVTGGLWIVVLAVWALLKIIGLL